MAQDGYSPASAFEWPVGQTRVVGNTAVRANGFPAMGVDWWHLRLRAGQTYRIQLRRPSFGVETSAHRYLSIYASLANAQGNSYYTRSYSGGQDGTYFPSISWTPSGSGILDWWLKVDDGNNGYNGYRGEYTLDVTPAPAVSPSVFVLGAAGTRETRAMGKADVMFPVLGPGPVGLATLQAASANFWNSVCWSPELGLFCAVAYYSDTGIMTSPNGVDWTLRSTPNSEWYGICWSPALRLFCAVGSYGDGGVMTSPDGIVWTVRRDAADSYMGVCWAPDIGRFCAVANRGGGQAMVSDDGTNWTTARVPVANQWVAVCRAPELGLFCAVAVSGVGNRVMTSPDGLVWTSRTSAANNSWTSVCWSAELGLLCAVADSGSGNRVMTSPNGEVWTTRSTPADNNWGSVVWAPEVGLFCAVARSGSGNRIMTSPDGVEWTAHASPADNNWVSACWSPALHCFASVASGGSGSRVMILPVFPRVDKGFHAIYRDDSVSARQGVRFPVRAPLDIRGLQSANAAKREVPMEGCLASRHALRAPLSARQRYADMPVYDPLQNPKAEELIAAWPLEEAGGTRYDLSPYRRELTEAGPAVGAGEGKWRSSAYFSGEYRQRLEGPNPFFETSKAAGSVSLWIRPDAEYGYGDIMTAGEKSPLLDRWNLALHSYVVVHNCYDDSMARTSHLDAGRVEPGEWSHIVLRWEGFRREVLVNGAFRTDNYDALFNMGGSSTLSLGASISDRVGYGTYYGLLDEVYCWDRALTADEVARLYANGEGLFITKEAGEEPFGGFHQIRGACRSFLPGQHRIDVGGRSAVHVAGWQARNERFTRFAASRHSILYPKRHHIVARDTASGIERDLGIAEESPDASGRFILADVPLPDGVYEIGVRSTEGLWADARSSKVSTYRLRAGEDPASELPDIVNLQAEVTANWWRLLSWSVAESEGNAEFSFGVWLDNAVDVDVTGDPAAVIARTTGLDYYEHFFQQTAPCYVAVAAFTPDGERGRPATLYLPWDATQPHAPTSQWATENGSE